MLVKLDTKNGPLYVEAASVTQLTTEGGRIQIMLGISQRGIYIDMAMDEAARRINTGKAYSWPAFGAGSSGSMAPAAAQSHDNCDSFMPMAAGLVLGMALGSG